MQRGTSYSLCVKSAASISYILTIKRIKSHMWTGRCSIFRIPACNATIESGRRWRQYLGFPHPVRGKHHVWMVDRSGQSHVFRCLSPLEIERFWKTLGRRLEIRQKIELISIDILILYIHIQFLYNITRINTLRYILILFLKVKPRPKAQSLRHFVAVMSVDVLAQDSIPWRLDDDRVMAAEGRFLCQNPLFSGWDRFFRGVKCTSLKLMTCEISVEMPIFSLFEVWRSDESVSPKRPQSFN